MYGGVFIMIFNVKDYESKINALSDTVYNHLCYADVITLAQSSSYDFLSPFLRAMFIGQINNHVHIIHTNRETYYASAEGFKTDINLMSITPITDGVRINNLNGDNVLRVFVLFK